MKTKAKKNLVRIGCYSAFWGDSVSAATQLIKSRNLDYLVADYLAEVTMGILARRRNQSNQKSSINEGGKDLGGVGEGGYIAEFISFVLKQNLPDIIKHKIKIVTNAGGLDPLACKLAIERAIQKAGVKEGQVIVAAITGDDILNQKNEIKNDFKKFSHVYGEEVDAESYPNDKEIISLNAYLGAIPIAKALDEGATIVITGRCVDSALVLGPLIHEFKWNPEYNNDNNNYWDKLALGSLAGHIIECGCQATGGNFTDWEQSAFSPNGGWANMGYPIVECFSNGEFIVTKPRETGGLVTTATVGEQMLYEILDPGSYILPDVILDMRNVKLKQIDVNKVLVTGAKGRAPTDNLKLSGIYLDGYKMTGTLIIGGIDAWKKATAVAHAVLLRTRTILAKLKFKDFRDLNVETLGAEHTYGVHARTRDTREVVLNITVHHDDIRALKYFGMELAPAATCMGPGITGGGTGRPHPSPCLVHFSCLLPKNKISAIVTVGNKSPLTVTFDGPTNNGNVIPSPTPSLSLLLPEILKLSEISEIPEFLESEENLNKYDLNILMKIPLIKLAWGRSGDKGDTCNIGIMARDPKYFPYIKRSLTEESVKEYFAHLCRGIVKRYELPGINGLNFVLTKSLGGGGLSSLQIDRQGKTYAQMLLSFKIVVPPGLFAKL
ncbi:hypothetical protein Glove_508g77 [Diversispora epigaea]|uniref:Terpene utilization protein AtuA n=2 Tax=Diversispora epigaea TaxID=1348612 RepID=A0A397GG63_9GLOM|nr:hypothetical protein Glove_508g77 [Diversispora epigaea]